MSAALGERLPLVGVASGEGELVRPLVADVAEEVEVGLEDRRGEESLCCEKDPPKQVAQWSMRMEKSTGRSHSSGSFRLDLSLPICVTSAHRDVACSVDGVLEPVVAVVLEGEGEGERGRTLLEHVDGVLAQERNGGVEGCLDEVAAGVERGGSGPDGRLHHYY